MWHIPKWVIITERREAELILICFPRRVQWPMLLHVALVLLTFNFIFIYLFLLLLAGAFAYCNPQNTSGESKLDYVTAEIQVR